MSKLFILVRDHYDYDDHSFEVVGVTDQPDVAKAFVQVGVYDEYWSNSAQKAEINGLDANVLNDIKKWLDPKSNPLCECGHRFLHHRRKNHTGSCKQNVDYGEKHKCKGFKVAKKQPLPAEDKVPYANN